MHIKQRGKEGANRGFVAKQGVPPYNRQNPVKRGPGQYRKERKPMQPGTEFNAEDWIRANGVAEAARTKALEETVSETERMLSEFQKTGTEGKEELLKSLEQTKETLEKRMARQEEYTHKESVRTYRNMQAGMVEELEKQTLTLKEELAAMTKKWEEAEKRNRRILPLVTLAVLMGLATLTIQVLDFTGVLSFLVDWGNRFFFG